VNTVLRDGVPVAFIDWDTAAPGPRAPDLGWAAWRGVPFSAAYGTDEVPGFRDGSAAPSVAVRPYAGDETLKPICCAANAIRWS
jgi:aminoglycoside phosphotransferase (APT) family kinase protein